MFAPPYYHPHMMYLQHMGIPSLGAATAASLMRGGPPPYYGGGWPGMGYGAGYPQHGGGGNPDQDAYRDRNSNMQGGGRVTASEQKVLAVISRQDTDPILVCYPGQVNIDPSASSSSSLSTSSPNTLAFKQPALSDDPFLASGPGQVNTDDHSASSSSSLLTSSPKTVAFKQPALADSLVASKLANGKALADSLVGSRLATAADIRHMGLPRAALRGMSW
jgi:hypothetical protein